MAAMPWQAANGRQGPGRPSGDRVSFLIATVLIIAILYIGREIFVPIALAILLSFVLAPLVRLLRSWYLPRTAAVVTAVLFAFSLIGALGWVMTVQVTELAEDLPRYQETMRAKIVSVKGAAAASGAMERAADVLARLGAELTEPEPEPEPVVVSPRPEDRPPVPVIVRDPPPGPLDTFQSLIEPLVHPFAVTGLVVIFVIFILQQREDLRNRFIKLVGSGDLQKTTEAIDDAGSRLSRLLLTQVMLNTAYGTVIAIGLGFIGVPIAALWGMLAGVLRFVPYVGALIGAAFPLLIAAAVDPGWTMFLSAALLFLVVEPILGHFIEPLVYGRSTGLSPVAVVVAATFWTWLWGPIGLVLATPLTVCAVVLGRHVKGLGFLEIMLGDRPVLSPPELFYQRMLAGDAIEMVSVAEEFLKARSLSEYYDNIALAGLRLANADLSRGVLDVGRLFRIRDTVEEVVEDLEAYEDVQPPNGRTEDVEAAAAIDAVEDTAELPLLDPAALPEPWRGPAAVVCLAGETPLDEAGALMLAKLVAKHGVGARYEAPDALTARRIFELSERQTAAVCLVFFGGQSAQMRHAVRRVRRRLPRARVLLCAFGASTEAAAADLVGRTQADLAAGTLTGALSIILREIRSGAPPASEEVPPRAATGS